MEHVLAPWCSFMILPLFAFCNAGVSLSNIGWNALTSPLTLGVTLGLLIGKPLGVFPIQLYRSEIKNCKIIGRY